MPRLNLKVVGNRLYSDVVDSSPRYTREAAMPSSSTVENFLRFQVQDKHNASYHQKILHALACRCKGMQNILYHGAI